MANVLTGKTKKPHFSHDCCVLRSRQRRVDRVVAQYLADHGHKMTDDAEREIGRLVFKVGQ